MSKHQRDRLVRKNMFLARIIGLEMRKALPTTICADDLINSGIIGLIAAAKHFDPKRNVKFDQYARFRIRGEILDSLREIDWASRLNRRLLKKIETIRKELDGIELSDEEIVKQLGITQKTYRNLVDAKILQLEVKETLDAIKKIPVKDPRPDALYAKKECSTILQAAISTLKPRYRTALIMYYMDEITMKEIGSKLGVNESRISQMLKAATKQLEVTMSEKKLTMAAFA